MSEFPSTFRWGVATSSYQIEGGVRDGGRGPSIWDTFTHSSGTIPNDENGDIAADFYNRLESDLKMLVDLGVDAFRFSISWPRVIPTGRGQVNPDGIRFYRRIAETVREYGITPYATLYHWDLPQPIEDEGGWMVRETAEAFRDYAVAVHAQLGDVIDHWITLNEPWCSSFLGYASGSHAPGHRRGTDALHAAHHLLLAHGLATQAIRAADATATIGITLNFFSVVPSDGAEENLDAARRLDGLVNRLFMLPVLRGEYPQDVLADTAQTEWFARRPPEDLATIGEPIDFLGINYYEQFAVAAATAPEQGTSVGETYPGSETVKFVERGHGRTDLDWVIVPEGLYEVLRMVHDVCPGLPIIVTENGAAFNDAVEPDGSIQDVRRIDFLKRHIDACARAIRDGVALTGYFVWTLLDDFEWNFGYAPRFGLIRVDWDTLERTPKQSAQWYRAFIDEQKALR